jgi:23S rRNA (uridine2552-2'-O)-methyltransferase
VGPSGRVVGVDLAETDPLPNENVIAFSADLTEVGVAERILGALGGAADVLLCDAAPKLTGVRATDRAREEALLEAIEALLPRILRSGGGLVLKLLESPEAQAVGQRIGRRFQVAKQTRLRATREGSSEKYLVAQGFDQSA